MTRCVPIPDGIVCFDDRDECEACGGTGICWRCNGDGCELCRGSGFCNCCGGEGKQPGRVNDD